MEPNGSAFRRPVGVLRYPTCGQLAIDNESTRRSSATTSQTLTNGPEYHRRLLSPSRSVCHESLIADC